MARFNIVVESNRLGEAYSEAKKQFLASLAANNDIASVFDFALQVW